MAFSTLLCCIENVLFTKKSRSYKLLALVSGMSERHSHCHTAMCSALEKECDGLHGTQPPYIQHYSLMMDYGSFWPKYCYVTNAATFTSQIRVLRHHLRG